MNQRSQKLVAIIGRRGLDAMLVSGKQNRRYFSGFTGSAGYLLITKDRSVLFTDARYTEQAASQSPHFDVVQVRGGLEDWLIQILRETGVQRIGFESDDVTVFTYNRMVDAIKEDDALGQVSLVAVSGITDELRVTKDQDEMVHLQKAIYASDSAMEVVCPTITAGMTEREVARRMEDSMREFGADTISFETIVAAGPNGAMAHHQPSDRVIQQGEPIVIDMGAKVEGYCSDITRTVVVGEPDDTFRKIYDVVLGAQLTAINTVRPHMSGRDCDGLSRSVIAEAGYGDNFGHSLGHGVGLAVHEDPQVGPRSDHELKSGMVFTVEPGIYISGWGGVRIEDIVILGDEGATPLSKAAK